MNEAAGGGGRFAGVVSGGSVEILPMDATIAGMAPTEIVVQPVVNGLAPGTYNGTITLQSSDGRVSDGWRYVHRGHRIFNERMDAGGGRVLDHPHANATDTFSIRLR